MTAVAVGTDSTRQPLVAAAGWSLATVAAYILAIGVHNVDGTLALVLGIAALTTLLFTKSVQLQFGIVWTVIAVGAAVQQSLDATTSKLTALLLVSATAFVATRGVAATLAGLRPHAARILALAALALAFLLRLLPATQGTLANGKITALGTSVQIGEFTEIVVVAAAAVVTWHLFARLGAARSDRGEFVELVAGSALVLAHLVLLVIIDSGPALMIVIALAAMSLLASRAMSVRLTRIDRLAAIALSVSALVLVGLQLGAAERLSQRFANVLDPDYQLGVAREAMLQGGLVGGGLGSSPLAPYISLKSTDLLPSVVGAELGLAVLALLMLATIGALTKISLRVRGTERLGGLVAVGLLAALVAQVAVTVGGVLGVIPLTGLSTPAITLTGSTLAPLLIAIAVADTAATPTGVHLPRPPISVLALGASLTAACVMLAMTASTGAYAVLMPRGDLVTRDGMLIATTGDDGERAYPGGALYGELGWMKTGYAAYGLEASAGTLLTCGSPNTPAEVLLQPLHPLPCHAADVVTTLDGDLQATASAAFGGMSGEAVVLDLTTGELLALYASPTQDPAVTGEQTIPTQLSMREGSAPGSTFKMVAAAVALLKGIDTSGAPTTLLDFGTSRILNAGGFTCPDRSVTTMISESCNTTAAYIAVTAGQDAFAEVGTTYFGLDLWPEFDAGPAEPFATGLGESPLTDAQLARTAIGQESVRSSALSLAGTTALVAHAASDATAGSAIPVPHVIAGTCTADGEYRAAATPVAFGGAVEPLPQAVAQEIMAGMRLSVEGGTATNLGLAVGPDLVLAAKTGTAEVESSATGYHRLVTVVVEERWVVTVIVEDAERAASSPAVAIASSLIAHLPAELATPDCPGGRP